MWQEDEEEDVRNYWMTLRTGVDTLIWRRRPWIALCGGIFLEEALDLSLDRILYECQFSLCWGFDRVLKFPMGFVLCVASCRCICFESNLLLMLVLENNRAILVSRCHGCLSHELGQELIDHINAEPLIVSGVFLMYFVIVFRVQIWNCSCVTASFTDFIAVLSLSLTFSNSAIYQATVLAQHNVSLHVSVVFLALHENTEQLRASLLLYKWHNKC